MEKSSRFSPKFDSKFGIPRRERERENRSIRSNKPATRRGREREDERVRIFGHEPAKDHVADADAATDE